MGIIQELKQLLQTALHQLTARSHTKASSSTNDTQELYFTKNFIAKAQLCGLTEADATDVYYHGNTTKENIMVRKYNGYEIGIYYFKDAKTGQTIITSIWKRDRR